MECAAGMQCSLKQEANTCTSLYANTCTSLYASLHGAMLHAYTGLIIVIMMSMYPATLTLNATIAIGCSYRSMSCHDSMYTVVLG